MLYGLLWAIITENSQFLYFKIIILQNQPDQAGFAKLSLYCEKKPKFISLPVPGCPDTEYRQFLI